MEANRKPRKKTPRKCPWCKTKGRAEKRKELAPFKEKMVKALMENHMKIVEDMFMRCFIDHITSDSKFRYSMEDAVHRVLSEERNRG